MDSGGPNLGDRWLLEHEQPAAAAIGGATLVIVGLVATAALPTAGAVAAGIGCGSVMAGATVVAARSLRRREAAGWPPLVPEERKVWLWPLLTLTYALTALLQLWAGTRFLALLHAAAAVLVLGAWWRAGRSP